MRKVVYFIVLAVFIIGMAGCDFDADKKGSDQIQQDLQETMLKESARSIGMPAIKNFRQKRILKDILELQDQDGLITYTYLQNAYTGKLRYFGETIGYGIPYATQFTNPQKVAARGHQYGYAILPQADPNGLFSPTSAESTWVLMKDPNSGKVRPIYVEPKIVVSPFKLPERLLEKD